MAIVAAAVAGFMLTRGAAEGRRRARRGSRVRLGRFGRGRSAGERLGGRDTEARRRRDARRHRHRDRAQQRRHPAADRQRRSPRCTSARASSSRAGELLFTLDARNDEVNVTKARAQLPKDLAALADAQRQLARSKDLFAQNFISQGAVDTNQTLVDSQQAVVASDRAAIEAAQVGLSYSRITAPSGGTRRRDQRLRRQLRAAERRRAGDDHPARPDRGRLQPAAAQPRPRRWRRCAAAAAGSRATFPEAGGTPTGRLQFVDNAVDANSGTVRVKAEFDNKDERLWPGAFVNVRLAVQTLKGAIVDAAGGDHPGAARQDGLRRRRRRQGRAAAGRGAVRRRATTRR